MNPLPQDPVPTSSSEEAGNPGESEFDVDAVINGLCDMFKEKNGRDPTDEEVKIWIEQLTGASEVGGGRRGVSED